MKGKLQRVVLITISCFFIYTMLNGFTANTDNILYPDKHKLTSLKLYGFTVNASNIKDSDKYKLTSLPIYGITVYTDNIKGENKRNLTSLANRSSTKQARKEEVVVSEECKGIKFVSNLIDKNNWLPVDEDRTMHVFSAYFIKARANVFVIGAKHVRTVTIFCQFWYHDKSSGIMVMNRQAIVRMPRVGQDNIFTSTIFECPVATSFVPSHISLSKEACKTPLNMLRVRDVSKPDKYKYKFAVCLSPLYYRYGRAYELVEWIELNRILGAEKFIVYNISTAINVQQVLEYYSKRGLTEVVQWRLPMAVKTSPNSKQQMEIHYFGQTAALNDCLFRSKLESEYIVTVDLDEFIIPHGNNLFNWTDVIKQVGGNTDAFVFRSTYFRKEWENTLDDSSDRDLVERFKLITLQKFEHEETVFSPDVRSKYIARTSTVDRVLTHEVPNKRPKHVPIENGLVHHYRNWFNQKDRKGQVRDETVKQKFGKNLIKRVQNIWKDLSEVKLDIPWE